MVMVGGTLADLRQVFVLVLCDGRGTLCLGCGIQRGAREAESDRHDQQAAKHEANAGHSTFLGVMAETDLRRIGSG
jgi:hypothetical protein